MNINKMLKSFSDQATAAIEAAGGSSLVIVAKEITLDDFSSYLTAQMAKAEADLTSGDMVTAAARLQSLMCSTAQVEAAFTGDVEKAIIPMISDSSTTATKALGDAAKAAANLAELAKKAKGDKTDKGEDESDKTDKGEGDKGEGQGDGEGDKGEGEDMSKDDSDWSGSDLNNDPALRKLLDDKND